MTGPGRECRADDCESKAVDEWRYCADCFREKLVNTADRHKDEGAFNE